LGHGELTMSKDINFWKSGGKDSDICKVAQFAPGWWR